MTEIQSENEAINIEIAPNARVFVCGKTGSGKTTFAKSVLKDLPRLVVIDSKGNLADDMDLVPANRKENWRRFLRGYPSRLQVTAPAGDDNDVEFYHEWFKRIFIVGDCYVYIDELMHVTLNAISVPKWLKAIYTRGREPIYNKGRIVGGNIGVMASTQRPSNIPVNCMTESEEFFIFQLQNPDDRKKVAAYTSPEVGEPIQDEHGFYYYKTRSNKPIYIAELPV